jgi:hypothetical protein
MHELLNSSLRGAMFFDPVHSKREIRAEELADLAFRIAPDFKSAATRGPLGTECGENEMTSRPERPAKNCEIALAIIDIGQKVEDCPVVPYRKRAIRLKARNVGLDPGDAIGKIAQPGSGVLKSARSDVDDGDI